MRREHGKGVYKRRVMTECINARFRQWGLQQFTVRGKQKVTTVLSWSCFANYIMAGHRPLSLAADRRRSAKKAPSGLTFDVDANSAEYALRLFRALRGLFDSFLELRRRDAEGVEAVFEVVGELRDAEEIAPGRRGGFGTGGGERLVPVLRPVGAAADPGDRDQVRLLVAR